MIDFKQLRYFIVCADVGSFSEAARILYTTQSNVSKAIHLLEKTVGVKLFMRGPRGASLTPQGKQVYQYACRIMEEVEELEDFSRMGETEWLKMSCNPSSWFADRFVAFYNLHEKEKLHCQIYTASVRRIINRVRDCRDEIGFVYVTGGKKSAFLYEISRNHLEFHVLADAKTMLYLGKKNPISGKRHISDEELKKQRFIQNYQDEFTENRVWSAAGEAKEEFAKLDVAVITNSDYIMERMLSESALANISGNYLTGDEKRKESGGIPLGQEEHSVLFGYLKREGEVLGKLAAAFIDFMMQEITEEK